MVTAQDPPVDTRNRAREQAASDSELRARVRDYFAMLEADLRGRGTRRGPFGRSAAASDTGAFERTLRQIAAVLIEQGLPYLSRYAPLSGHSPRVREAVERYLLNHPELLRLMEAEVDESVGLVPEVAGRDLADIVVHAPEHGEIPRLPSGSESYRAISGTDCLAREQRNASLARAGELFVLNYEVTRLRAAGADAYADCVEHVAAEHGGGRGHDIHSYDVDGRDRYIKVKTTRYRRETPFFVTSNEVAMANVHRQHFWLYRVFDFRTTPRLYAINGALHERFHLEPVAYRATPR